MKQVTTILKRIESTELIEITESNFQLIFKGGIFTTKLSTNKIDQLSSVINSEYSYRYSFHERLTWEVEVSFYIDYESTESTIMEERLIVLKGYLKDRGIDSDECSPNLIADICFNYFPQWEVTSEEIVYLSDNT